MKKRLFLLLGTLSIILCSCGQSISQEEYDNVVAERDSHKEQYENANEVGNPESTTGKENVYETSMKANITEMYPKNMPNTEAVILENVEITTEKAKNGDIIVFLMNSNEYVIPDIELQAIFYKDGEIIDTDKDGHDVVVPRNIVVSTMDAPDNYDNFEVLASIEWDVGSSYRNWIYNLEVNSNIGDDNIIIQFENIGKVSIEELEYIVVFYLEGDVARTSFAKDVSDVGAGDKIIEEVSAYGIEYDEYAVFINQAHTFSEENIDGELARDTLPVNIMKKCTK